MVRERGDGGKKVGGGRGWGERRVQYKTYAEGTRIVRGGGGGAHGSDPHTPGDHRQLF